MQAHVARDGTGGRVMAWQPRQQAWHPAQRWESLDSSGRRQQQRQRGAEHGVPANFEGHVAAPSSQSRKQ